jgi:hypothetical protein
MAARAPVVHRGRSIAVAAGVLAGLTLVLYGAVISQQSTRDMVRVGLVVALLLAAVAGVIVAVGAASAEMRAGAGTVAAGLLLSLGVLGMFSVGLPLFVAGVLMVVWIVRSGSLRAGRMMVLATFLVSATIPWVLLLLS